MNVTSQPKAYAGDIPVYCSHDAIVAIEEVKGNPRNPNQHPPEQLKLLAAIIQRQGWRAPITVSTRSGYIVKGHGRLQAALLNNASHVPVDYQSYASDEEELADLIADNRIAELAEIDSELLVELFAEIKLDPDFDITLTGFTDDEYEDLLSSLSEDNMLMEIAEDEVPELEEEKEPFSKPGDIWILGRHKLICGDSTKADTYKQLLGDEKAKLIITDPPYNVDYHGTAGSIMNDNMSDNAFYCFLYDAFKCMIDNIEPGAAAYIWHADSEGRNFRNAFQDAGFMLKQCIVWVKNSLVLGRQDYQWQHEPCLYGWKDGAAHYFIDDRKQTTIIEEEPIDFNKMKKDELLKFIAEHISNSAIPTSAIYEDKPKKNDLHPTMKPIKLISRIMANSSKPGWIVLDPFSGSGSTMIAAELTGRTARVIEMDARFVDVDVKRYIMTTGKKDICCIRNGEKLSEEEIQKIIDEC